MSFSTALLQVNLIPENSQNIYLNNMQNTNLNNIKPSVLTLALAANTLL